MLHQNCQRVQAALKESGLEVEIKELPDSTRTAKEAAATVGVSVAEIAKSIVFEVEDDLLLVIASGVNRVSTSKLECLVRTQVKQANPDKVKAVTGYAIGGVPPVGHNSRIPTFIDQDLLKFEFVWAAAGTPKSVFRCATKDLIAVTAGQIADVREE